MYDLSTVELDPNLLGVTVEAPDMEYIFQATDPNNPVPGTGLHFERAFYADLLVTERMYGVTITVQQLSGAANWMGWPSVTVSGSYENVFRCLADNWGSNETPEEMTDFVHMLLGDQDAADRWNSSNTPHLER